MSGSDCHEETSLTAKAAAIAAQRLPPIKTRRCASCPQILRQANQCALLLLVLWSPSKIMNTTDPNPFADGCTVIIVYSGAKPEDKHLWPRPSTASTMGLSNGWSDVSNAGATATPRST
jgi:hypothetical protein